MGRRILNRKELRDNFDAAERRTEDEEPEEDEEEGDEDEEEEEGDEEAAPGGAEDDDEDADEEAEGGEDDDEDAPKKKKKKKVVVKAKPKAKAPAKSRTRVAKVVRMRIVWGVYDNSHRMVATFDYPKKGDAEAHAAKLMADKRSTHFVQPLKVPIEEPKKEK